MKVVVNEHSVGIGKGLSLKGIKRYLELIGKECYFYKNTVSNLFCNNDLYKYELVDISYTDTFPNITVTTEYLGKNTNGLIPKEFCFDIYSINRRDPILIQVIEELGNDANNSRSKFIIKEIPDNINVSWYVRDCNGSEVIALDL